MPPERIVPLPASENFWSVGGPGPCGPDSELYCDWGAEAGCGEPDCQPGLHALRAVPRVLEPRLHGVRAPPGRDADAAAEAEHRHRDGPRAHGARSCRTCRRSTTPTATSGSCPGSPSESGVAYGDSAGRDEGPPRPRRPRPRHDLPRRRRRHAVERGTRLRAPPRHPPRRPARPPDRHERRSSPASPTRDRADGDGLPGAGRARDRIAADPPRRGGALRRDARARDEALRGGRPSAARSAARTRSRSRPPTASRSS